MTICTKNFGKDKGFNELLPIYFDCREMESMINNAFQRMRITATKNFIWKRLRRAVFYILYLGSNKKGCLSDSLF